MSNNHPHDNIYSILGKLDKLKPKEQPHPAAPAQKIYESVEAQGSMLEGVSKVEQQLAEKYMGFKKTAAAVAKSGADNPEALAAWIGRKKYGKKKFQKAAAAGKKLGEGATCNECGMYESQCSCHEGNLFTGGLEDNNVKIGDTIPGTNAIKTKDLEEGPMADKVKKGVAAAAMVGLGAGAMNPDNYNHKTPTPNQAKAQQQSAEKQKTKSPGEMDEDKLVHKGRYGNDGKDYTGKTGGNPKVQPDPTNAKFDTKGIAGMIGKKTGNKDIGKVSHRQKHEWDNSPEEVDEMFSFDTKGRDTGKHDELARRAKLGSAPLAGRYGKEYKEKDRYGDIYKIGGPKNKLPEGNDPFANVDSRVAKPTIPGTKNKAKSAYYPSNKPGQVQKLDKPTNKYDNVKNEGEKPHPMELDMIGKTREMGVQNRARDAEQRMANRAAEPKNAWQHTKKVIGEPLGKLARGDIKGALSEGFNFADMMKETGSTVKELLAELQDEIKTFEQTGHCGDKLEACLKIHNHGKNRLVGETGNPRGYPTPSGVGTQHAMELNPDLNTPLPTGGVLGKIGGAIKAGATAVAGALGGPNDTGHLAKLRDKMYKENAELNELAKLAGLAVQEGYEGGTCSGCGMTECECEPGMGDVPGMAQDGKISVNSSMSTDGDKHITVTADGAAVDELMQMLKIAGLDGFGSGNSGNSGLDGKVVPATGEVFNVDDGEDLNHPGAIEIHGTMDADGADQLADQLRGEEGVEEEYANEPNETYGTIKNITTQGDDMHREKDMYGGPGDNPRTQRPNRPAQPVLALEAELAAEYESIKKSL